MRLCAVCLRAASYGAAHIVFIVGDQLHDIGERYTAFARLVERVRSGNHPRFDPFGTWQINQVQTTVEAVTTVNGTEVCAAHLMDVS